MADIKSKFMFTSGKNVYVKYNKNYKTHKKGYVILSPPGSGKTTFVKNQIGKRDWIDQDDLFKDLGVNWQLNKKNDKEFKLNYLRADYMSEQSKLLGYRIIGSLFWEYVPDAIVIIPLKLHKKYVSKRKDLNLKTVMTIGDFLLKQSKKHKIPVFDNIVDAVNYLENKK
jgi:hypothetical protein